MQNIRVPGLAWIALIMAVVGWLQGDWFAGEPWVPGVVLVLTAAGVGRVRPDVHLQQLGRSASDDAPGRAFQFFWA